MIIQDKMKHALTICQNNHARLTDIRREVLAFLYAENKPLSAYDLLAKLRAIKPNAEPPTVYRALDFLISQRLIHRIETSNTYIACNHPHEVHTEQLFSCKSCGIVVEIIDQAISQAIDQCAQKNHFNLHNSSIELRGVCLSCQ